LYNNWRVEVLIPEPGKGSGIKHCFLFYLLVFIHAREHSDAGLDFLSLSSKPVPPSPHGMTLLALPDLPSPPPRRRPRHAPPSRRQHLFSSERVSRSWAGLARSRDAIRATGRDAKVGWLACLVVACRFGSPTTSFGRLSSLADKGAEAKTT
jgi:hypothetical protein